jgi:hypothetical protein
MPDPADVFYRLRFVDRNALRDWSLQVLDTIASREDAGARTGAAHPVIFVPAVTPQRGAVYAFVSATALWLPYDETPGVHVEKARVALRELPDGLAVLVGHEEDARAYERRGAPSER